LGTFEIFNSGFNILMNCDLVTVPEQPDELVIVSVTLYVPFEAYVCVGFFCVEVPPSPKFHCHATALGEISWKFTVNGPLHAFCTSDVKSAVGGGNTVMFFVIESLQTAYLFTTFTGYTPAVVNVLVGLS
jgi:hypothetical protein